MKYQCLMLGVLCISACIDAVQDGTPNSLFGTNGQVLSDYGFPFAGINANNGVIQNDDKILVTGDILFTGIDHMAVARFNIDGTLDTTFGNQGVTDLIEQANGLALAIQSDQKIIVAGFSTASGNLIMARYNLNGSLDASFVMTPSVAIDNSNLYVSIQHDGKIVVGANSNNHAIIVRYNSDGSLDTTFNPVNTNFGFPTARVAGLFVQNDDKIIILGYVEGPEMFAARYLSNGLPDTSFGTQAGYITFGDNFVYAGVFQADGKIVLIGTDSSDNFLLMARLTNQGLPDATFGTNGIVITTLTVFPVAGAVQSDGKILFAGDGGSSYDQACIGRYTSAGALDTSFGQRGLVLATDHNQSQYFSILINAQGKITSVSTAGHFARLIQYTCDSLHYSSLSQAVWQAYYNR